MTHKGSCLCGAVTFTVESSLDEASACHCSRCRKWTGHFLADAEVPRDAVSVAGEENIRWYSMSEKARRGFCATCGSSLFFDPLDKVKHGWIGIALGAFDAPTRTKLKLHIFTANKGDYYEILDGVPRHE